MASQYQFCSLQVFLFFYGLRVWFKRKFSNSVTLHLKLDLGSPSETNLVPFLCSLVVAGGIGIFSLGSKPNLRFSFLVSAL